MRFVQSNNKKEWNKIVKSFNKWDVYYLQEYVEALSVNGEGAAELVSYEDDKCKLCYVVMKNDLAQEKYFKGILEPYQYYDFTTPYGYGGPLIEGDMDVISQKNFIDKLNRYCYQNGIITQFIRFHPLLSNHEEFKNIWDIREIKQSIYIDTSNIELINKNLDSKNRNMIRKAEKLGVAISYDTGEKIEIFKDIYLETMLNNKAEIYYFFEDAYYEHLKTEMKDNFICFYSHFGDKIISAAIFFYNDKFMHYHLSGTLKEYRNMASMNLLLYNAATWACKKGIKMFHLGGGLSKIDSLYKFKKSFNKNGEKPFFIGRTIFNQEIYDKLLQIRLKRESNFEINNSNLIQYRKE